MRVKKQSEKFIMRIEPRIKVIARDLALSNEISVAELIRKLIITENVRSMGIMEKRE